MLILWVAFHAGAVVADRAFGLELGPYVHHFVQTEDLSAHAVVRTNSAPRIIVATPAGDTGAGLWFKHLDRERGLRLEGAGVTERQGTKGLALELSGPARLEVERVMLDSVRALRDRDHGDEAARDARLRQLIAALRGVPADAGGLTDELRDRAAAWLQPLRSTDPAQPGRVAFERRAFASGARYRVELIARAGTRIEVEQGGTVIVGDGGTRFGLRVFLDRPALRPLPQILTDGRGTTEERNLHMLVYGEKLVAGSYQYLTYFGRDTLIAAALLGDDLALPALAVAIASVLDRVSADGRVAHEESIGDQATHEALPAFLRDLAAGAIALSPSVISGLERDRYDYKMIDGELLLPPVVLEYLARARPEAIAATLTPPRIAALRRVLTRIVDETARWPGSSSPRDLLSLRPGQYAGNWRDSEEGLGQGRTPLDVNAYLAPAALDAMVKLLAHPRFPGTARPSGLRAPGWLVRRAHAWRRAAEPFAVQLDAATARERLRAYLKTFTDEEQAVLRAARLWSGVSVGAALEGGTAPELDGGLRFFGVSLDREGRPIPVLCSDEAFELFYGQPSPARVIDVVRRLFQPFPVGLMTPVGMLVANPGYSDRPGDARRFDRDHYHGAVAWSWPQTLFRKGVLRQLQRLHGEAEVERVLGRALAILDEAQAKVGAMNAAELWSWKVERAHIVAVPFGASLAHETEGAALLLLSNTRARR